MEANPDEGKELRRKNRSFVFFQETALAPQDECIGAQGIPLTPRRSLAVDTKIHVYGTPIWIDAELPISEREAGRPNSTACCSRRIPARPSSGPARADIYFGHGEEIGHIAGRIKQYGQFVMLVPQQRGGDRQRQARRPGHSAAAAAAEGHRADDAPAPARCGTTAPLPKPRP